MSAAFVQPLPTTIRAACAGVADPEFGVSVVDLGLIGDIVISGGAVAIAMTLTTPHCPASAVIVEGVRAAVAAVPGVTGVDIRLVWEPAWTPERISPQGRAQLGWT